MDERKQLLTDKIKAIAKSASVFIIIIAIIVLILSVIFEYGEMLQQESDDTV